MSLILDTILLLIIVCTVISSMRKGFLRSVLSLACVIIAIIAASALYKPAAEWCYDNVLDSIVVNSIEDKISSISDNAGGVNPIQSAIDSIPDIVINQLGVIGVDLKGLTGEISLMNLSAEEAAKLISEYIVRPGALVTLKLITYLILYLIIRFLCNIVANIIHRLLNVSLLKKANKLLGAGLGLVKGAAIVVALATLLNLYADIVKNNDPLYEAIEFSYICDIIDDVDFLGFIAK